jgi:HEAT repeat protein
MDFYRPPTLQGTLDALGSVNRALRAWKFYPQRHPTRKSCIKLAHDAMLQLLDGNNLSLNCGRTDFSFPDGESLKDSTRMSSGLSYELFIRRVQKITFLADLRQEDLLDLLRLLTIPPDAIHKSGGMDKLMSEHGIRTIWANEFDLSIIRAKRLDVESSGKNPLGLDDLEDNPESLNNEEFDESVEFLNGVSPADQMQRLLDKLSVAVDEDLYLLLVRQAIACSDDLKARNELAILIPLIEMLAEHAQDSAKGDNLRERAHFGLEQLIMGDQFLVYLLERLGPRDGLSHHAGLAVLSAAGQAAITKTVEKMGATENLAIRKALSALLVGLGESAIPPILRMMGDHRWYIVRNLAAVLGEIGSIEAIFELQKCLQHSDIRVCKEAVRSLAKIGGRDAETAIIQVLQGNDPSLFPQAITSLGGMKSRKALVELMTIVCRRDMLLKSLPLKLAALNAITMIGDRQVVPVLILLMTRRHIMAPSRWKQFKVAIAACLARLGDARALPVLRKKASDSGELGRACAEAVEIIERVGGEPHGVA